MVAEFDLIGKSLKVSSLIRDVMNHFSDMSEGLYSSPWD